MTVRFLRRSDGQIDTLHGVPFPSEEIQALWNMITEDVTVEWVATGIFILRFPNTSLIMASKIATIYAKDGHNYNIWARTLQRLL